MTKKKLRNLSGKDIIKILGKHGFVIKNQRGSHIKLTRILATGHSQILTVPNHKQLDKGTLTALFKQTIMFIPADAIMNEFYTK